MMKKEFPVSQEADFEEMKGAPKFESPTMFLPGAIILCTLLLGAVVYYSATLITAAVRQSAVSTQNAIQAFGTQFASQLAQSQPAAAAAAPAPAVAPDAPVTVKDRSDAPVIGKSTAKLTLYEFSDFQCPFCTSFYKETWPKLKADYIDTGKVKMVYRHFPLSFHVNAQKAAEAGECANQQGKFETYFNLLFSHSNADGTGLAVPDLKHYAQQAGLDTATFNNCLDTDATASIITADMNEGTSIGVNGTPTFVLNGQRIVGAVPFDTFKTAIDKALQN